MDAIITSFEGEARKEIGLYNVNNNREEYTTEDQVMEALEDGRCLTQDSWMFSEYLTLKDEVPVYRNGAVCNIKYWIDKDVFIDHINPKNESISKEPPDYHVIFESEKDRHLLTIEENNKLNKKHSDEMCYLNEVNENLHGKIISEKKKINRMKKEIKKLKYELESEQILSRGHCDNYNDLKSQNDHLKTMNADFADKLSKTYNNNAKYEAMKEVHIEIMTNLLSLTE